MKILYLDCFSGISGDMLIGALLDAGLNFNKFRTELNKLKLDFELQKKKVKRGVLTGTKFSVIAKCDASYKNFSDIETIIRKSRLSKDVKRTSLEIFKNLARSETKLHGGQLKITHLHEVGMLDSIVDVVGTAVALKELRIDRVYSSVIRLGRGELNISHGKIPIPAPATIELLKKAEVRFTNIKNELVTPTGAAVLRTFALDFGDMPDMKVSKVGYGAGSRDLASQPNLLRVVIGSASPYLRDTISVIETNIDDMNPEIFEFLSQKLFKAGSLDVFLTPVFMKKYRPGILLTVLCKKELIERVCSIIFKETTAIGARFYTVKRNKLERCVQKVQTKYGEVRAKLSFSEHVLKIQPEYDDCKKIARKRGIPIKKIYEETIFNRR